MVKGNRNEAAIGFSYLLSCKNSNDSVQLLHFLDVNWVNVMVCCQLHFVEVNYVNPDDLVPGQLL